MLREKRTFRPSEIGRENAKRPQTRDTPLAARGGWTLRARSGEMEIAERKEVGAAPGRMTLAFTTAFAVIRSRHFAGRAFHRAEPMRSANRAILLAPRGSRRPPFWSHRLREVKVHAFTVSL